MSRALIYAPEALTDLHAATLWLTQPGSGAGGRAKLDAILKAIDNLRHYPCRWPIGRHSSVRERPCADGWRIFYEVDPDTGRDDTAGDVRVLRIYGPGQDRRGFGS